MTDWFDTIANLLIFPICCLVSLTIGVILTASTKWKKARNKRVTRELALDNRRRAGLKLNMKRG